MNDIDRKTIQLLRVFLVKKLSKLDEILDILKSNEIISEQQRAIILSNSSETQKIRCFLDTLVRCGPFAFSNFEKALEQTKQQHILESLEANAAETEYSCKQTPTASVRPHTDVNPTGVADRAYPKYVTLTEPYTVASDPHGYVLIINIENYTIKSNVTGRKGSAEDVSKLASVFKDFSYSVAILKDLTGRQLEHAIKEFADKPEHKDAHACGLIMLSHGLQHHVIASDGGLVNIDWIISNFTNKNCPRLAGKPKLLLIQACRGESRDMGTFVHQTQELTVSNDLVDHSMDPASLLSLPHLCDCVIVYTTLPGFVSWRSETEGSWYITHFVDVFRRYGHQLHVVDLLTQVNNKLVTDASKTKIFQISQPAITLTKPFFLSTVGRSLL